jgi:hypothetical protein
MACRLTGAWCVDGNRLTGVGRASEWRTTAIELRTSTSRAADIVSGRVPILTPTPSWILPRVHRGAVQELHGPSTADTRSHRNHSLKNESCMTP